MRTSARALASALLAVTLAAACGGDGGGGGGPNTISGTFKGVIGGNNGTETGSLLLTLQDNGTGSGSFKIGGNTTPLTGVSITGTTVTASGGGYGFTGTVSGVVIDGTYTSPGGGGLLAALEVQSQVEVLQFCGTHDAGPVQGVFAFAYNTTTNAIRGVWTSGPSSGFKGIVSGFSGPDGGVMSGHPGTVNITPNLPNNDFDGDFDLDSGEIGTMTGPICP